MSARLVRIDRRKQPEPAAAGAESDLALLLRVRDVARLLSLSERKVWLLIQTRRLAVVKLDGATRVTRGELERLIQDLKGA